MLRFVLQANINSKRCKRCQSFTLLYVVSPNGGTNLITFLSKSMSVFSHAAARPSTPGIRSNSVCVCGRAITIKSSVCSVTSGGAGPVRGGNLEATSLLKARSLDFASLDPKPAGGPERCELMSGVGFDMWKLIVGPLAGLFDIGFKKRVVGDEVRIFCRTG